MLIEHTTFDRRSGPPARPSADAIYRYCRFERLAIDGMPLEGALLSCTLVDLDWTWGLFNTAVIAGTGFEGCVFRGASFRGCQFNACTFVRCRFVPDSADAACTFDDCSLTECVFDGCEFLPGPAGRHGLFTDTRWFGCRQKDCTGLEGQF